MEIIIIAAIGKSKQLGLKGKIPWHIKEDLQQFKKRTIGHTIVMGRNTFESLPGTLKERRTIVISNTMKSCEDLIVLKSLAEAIKFAKEHNENKLFICGGAKLYKEALDHATQMYLSYIDYDEKADVFFPDFEPSHWQEILRTQKQKAAHSPSWNFVAYNKKRVFLEKALKN